MLECLKAVCVEASNLNIDSINSGDYEFGYLENRAYAYSNVIGNCDWYIEEVIFETED